MTDIETALDNTETTIKTDVASLLDKARAALFWVPVVVLAALAGHLL